MKKTILVLSLLWVMAGTAPASAAVLGENPRLGENFLNTGIGQAAGDVNRDRLPGSCGSCLARPAECFVAPGEQAAGEAANLTGQQQRAVQSLREQIAEHQQKLADYIKNPDAFDNQGFLKNAPTPEIRQSIIDGRIRHLQNEISAFQDGINKILGGG